MVINGFSPYAQQFAFDCCHHIRFVESETDKKKWLAKGYTIRPIAEFEGIISNCILTKLTVG